MSAAPSPWPETRISDWAELQELVDTKAGICVFRGQGSADWPLKPSFNRAVGAMDEAKALRLEMQSLLMFRSQAHSFIPPSVMPPNMFSLRALDTYLEWLMLMQHYGAPTRLLDWSQSPYVAIYFAVIDCTHDDAALWYFASDPVDQAVYAHYGRTNATLLDYADFTADEIRRPDAAPLLYTAQKKLRSAREVAQQGVFTFSNRIDLRQQDVIAQTCADAGAPFGRVIIPHALKLEISFRLSLMNVTAATLFPGLEGVSTSIRDWLRREAMVPVQPPPPPPSVTPGPPAASEPTTMPPWPPAPPELFTFPQPPVAPPWGPPPIPEFLTPAASPLPPDLGTPPHDGL